MHTKHANGIDPRQRRLRAAPTRSDLKKRLFVIAATTRPFSLLRRSDSTAVDIKPRPPRPPRPQVRPQMHATAQRLLRTGRGRPVVRWSLRAGEKESG